MASPKPEENTEMEEDVPEGFFDDFSNNDFMAGLDVVDAWEDNVDGKPPKEKTTTNEPKSTTGTKSKTTDAKRNNAKKPKPNNDKKRKAAPPDDKVRRDPNKTKRDIQRYKIKCAKDKEAKYVSEKLRVVETGLVPPGTEMEADVDFVKEQAKRPDLRSRIKERQRRSHSTEKVEKPEKVIIREASPSQLTEGKPRRMSSREPRERDRRTNNRRSRSHEQRHRFNNRRSISPLLLPRYRGGGIVKQQKHRSRSRSHDYRNSRFSNERHRSPREMELTRGLQPEPPPRSLSPFNKKGQTFLEELERKLNNQRPNFLDEMREKFSATPSSNSPHLPEHMGINIPPPNMMQMQHNMCPPQQQLSQPPYGLISPAPVPVPPVFVHMQQQQQQSQIYDQNFFIGQPQPEMMVNQNPVLIPNNLGSGFMPMPSNNLPQQQQHNIPPQQQHNIPPQQQQQHNIPPQQLHHNIPPQQLHHNIPPQQQLHNIPLQQQQQHIPQQQQHHNLPPQHPNMPLQLPSPIQPQQSYQANLTKVPQLVANMIDKTSLNKLFNDKQISLTDFLSITSKVSGGSKPADLSKKIKVISLCQDAIKIMNKDSKLSGRFFFKKSTRAGDNKPTSTQSKTASPLKRTLPIRYTYTSSTSKGELSRNSPHYTNAQRLLIKMGIVQVSTSAGQNIHRGDTPDPPNISPQTTTIATTNTTTTTTKDSNNKKQFNWKEERNVLNKMCQTDRVSPCSDCSLRKKKTFATIGTQCEVKHFESVSVQVKEDDFLSPARAALKGLLKSQSLASLTPAQLLAQMGGGKSSTSSSESLGEVKRLRTDSAGSGMGLRRDMDFEAPRKMYFEPQQQQFQPPQQQFPQPQQQQNVWQGGNKQFNQGGGGQQFGGPNNQQQQQQGFQQPPQNQQNLFPNNWNQNSYGGNRF